jgi:hypothetical protein
MSVPLFANNAVGTLAAAYTPSATALTLTAGQGILFPAPNPANDEWFPVTIVNVANQIEIVKCTARTADTLTVARGQEGTPARSLGIGEKVEHRLTAAALVALRDKILTAAQVPNNLITGPMLAPDSVTSGKIKDGNIGPPEIFDQAVTPAKLAVGAAVANIGYTPVKSGGGYNADAAIHSIVLSWTTQNKLGLTVDLTDIGWILTEHPSGKPDTGGYRGAPVNVQDGNYVITPQDTGKMIQKRSAGTSYYTLPGTSTAAWYDGGAIIKVMTTNCTIVLTPAADVLLISMKDGAQGARTLNPFTSAILEQVGSNIWYIYGTGNLT